MHPLEPDREFDFQIADLQGFAVPYRGAPQQQANAGLQFGKGERFDQVIGGAKFQPFCPVAYGVARSQEKYG